MVEVELDSMGFRCPCLACGATIEKFELHGFAVVGDTRFMLCSACMVGGGLAARLVAQAEAVRGEANWIESLAALDWHLPTEAEVVVAQAEQEVGWAVLRQEEGLT
jgi:hypothetical protein